MELIASVEVQKQMEFKILHILKKQTVELELATGVEPSKRRKIKSVHKGSIEENNSLNMRHNWNTLLLDIICIQILSISRFLIANINPIYSTPLDSCL